MYEALSESSLPYAPFRQMNLFKFVNIFASFPQKKILISMIFFIFSMHEMFIFMSMCLGIIIFVDGRREEASGNWGASL